MGVILEEEEIEEEILKLPFVEFEEGDIVNVLDSDGQVILTRVIVRGYCLDGSLVVMELHKMRGAPSTEALIIESSSDLVIESARGKTELVALNHHAKSFYIDTLDHNYIRTGGNAECHGVCDDGSFVIQTLGDQGRFAKTSGLKKALIIENKPLDPRRKWHLRAKN